MKNPCAENGFSRLEFEGTPIYVDPLGPDWFVPNTAGDALLKGEISHHDESAAETLARERFLALLKEEKNREYSGRYAYLSLSHLEECWLHITDICNLSCRHCLFSCSSGTRRTLSLNAIRQIIDEACAAGVRTFFLTGGEPMMHPDFSSICRLILDDKPDTVLVILTNGLLLKYFADLFAGFPEDRLFLQISVDGPEKAHDSVRGKGNYKKLIDVLSSTRNLQCAKTLAMATHAGNADHMGELVGLASAYDISSIHYLWLFQTGNAGNVDFVDPKRLFSNLRHAAIAAEEAGVTIDNINNMASRVFSPGNTRHDMSNAGWRSIAIGPDGMMYPTPALVGQSAAACGDVRIGLANIWKTSPHLTRLRKLSVIESKSGPLDDPLALITGGGDMDHCFYAAGNYLNGDPYLSLYRNIALWLIEQEAAKYADSTRHPRIRLKMGDRVAQCRMDGQAVSLTHSNCVLTVSNPESPTTVAGDFYSKAALSVNTNIANPACYPDEVMRHIPQSARIRSYGCGSPVLDAGIREGETIVDLGSGAGMECFIAAHQAGRKGRVFGIDMSDPMIAIAEKLKTGVSKNLGYDNIRFLKGLLEKIPLPDNCADAVISNCVINLSGNKRRTFLEIYRILKPGGRIMISDVITDKPVPPHITGDGKLRGECLAGAMVQPYLLSILESTGFAGISLKKRFLYREVDSHRFYSLTYGAGKPDTDAPLAMVYPGPFAAVITDDGQVLHRGKEYQGRHINSSQPAPPVFTPGVNGDYGIPEGESPCACALPPVRSGKNLPGEVIVRHASGCTLCGQPLVYLDRDVPKTCNFCSRVFNANAVCRNDHYVCDSCHGADIVEIVRHICINTNQTDMAGLAETIRSHPAFPVHGPEHHFMVPAIILAAYRNAGGSIADEAIITGIGRGQAIPGGSCAFWGICGAAAGAGIALGIIIGANPLIADKRRVVQEAVGAIIAEITRIEAPRCCRRETLAVLEKTAHLSESLLPVKLAADDFRPCRQMTKNRECIADACPYVGRRNKHTAVPAQTR